MGVDGNKVEETDDSDKDVSENKKETSQCSKCFQQTAKNIVIISPLLEFKEENKFDQSEESKLYRKFLETWERYFKYDEFANERQKEIRAF